MKASRKKIITLIQSKITSNQDMDGDQKVIYHKKINEMFKVFDDNNGKPIVIKREIRKILSEL